jgi:hypothetical protein
LIAIGFLASYLIEEDLVTVKCLQKGPRLNGQI